MKKILKVKIKRNQEEGKTSYVYPTEYDPKKFQVIIYETQIEGNLDKVRKRGNKTEYVIGAVEEENAPSFLRSSDIVEITRSEAEKFAGPELDRTVDKILDRDKVMLILAKSVKGEPLSPDELKIIDSDDPTPGLNKSKSLRKALDEYGL